MAQTRTDDPAVESEAPKAKPKRISKRKATEQHARSYFEAIDRRDVCSMLEHWREDGLDELLPVGILRGRGEIAGFFNELFAAVPDLSVTVTRMVVEGGLAVVEWRMEGTFDGDPFQGIDPTGRHVELRGLDLLEIEDDLIVGNTAYYDGMAFARQVGMMPDQDSGAERAMKGAFNAVTKARRVIAERTGG